MTGRVKICAGWATSQDITERLLKQFQTGPDDLDGITIVHDDSYDLIVFFNYVNEPIKPDARGVLFANEPTWSGSHQKNIAQYHNLTYFGFDKNDYSNPERVIELPARCFYGGRGPWVDKLDIWSYENLAKTDFQKTENISSVITTWGDPAAGATYPPSCTYPERYELIHSIIDRTEFVTYFGGWDTENSNRSPLKIDAVRNFKFCLVAENEYKKNWITEKFYDCILTNTVPIYYGCPNILELWGERSHMRLDSLDPIHVLDVLEYVEKNADELYNMMLPHLLHAKSKYLHHYNVLKLIRKIALQTTEEIVI